MTTQTDVKASGRSISAETVIGCAILGCLVAGIVGIIKAITMDSGSGAALCLLASVAAFGTVCFVYLRKG
jgi:hypothetical protein